MYGSKKHPTNMFIHATKVEKPNTGTIKIRRNSMTQGKLIDTLDM